MTKLEIDTNGIALEDRVEDGITGITGKAVAFAQHVTGCARVGIQPSLDKDGKVPEWYWADVLTVTVIRPGPRSVAAEPPARKGGPQRHEPRGRFR